MKKGVYIFIIFFLLLLFLEIFLRFLGYSPVEFGQKISCKPEICYTSDSLGISLKPGNYKVKINDCIDYQVTHTNDGRRITSNKISTAKDKIFIFGCSFAYGVGVNDQEAFPFLLQNLLLQYEVYNYAIPGSGTVQSFLYLKKSLESGQRPKIVVLSYATFHEERNLLTRSFESKLYEGINFHEGFELSKFYYPCCVIKNNKITIESIDIIKDFKPIPFVKYSAMATFVNQTWNKLDYLKTDGFLVSEIFFKKMNKLAKQYHFKLIIADVSYNEKSNEIDSICVKNNLNYVNISPDYSIGNYSLAPCDFHPNQSAHQIYAQKLYEHIKNYK
jgi:hypothetical protein